MPAQEFTYSRRKTALLLLGSLVFVAIAVFLPWTGQSQVSRLLCGVFFGVGAIVFVGLLLRPLKLTLNAEGFTLSGGLMLPSRVKKIAWRDVDEFFTYRTGHGSKMIGINFKEGASERTRFTRFSRTTFGADGALPGLWRGGCDAMVQQLIDYRARALGDQPIPTARRSSAG